MNTPTATLILTAAVAGVTVYIAIQQWLTAKNKFRLDLFDRRFPVFEEAMRLAIAIGRKGICTDEHLREYAVATKGVLFLFNQEMEDYCRKLYNEAISVQVGKEKMEALPPGDERRKSAEAWGGRMKWFNEQVDEMPKRFAPFLKIHG
jgi:hypothetical protein